MTLDHSSEAFNKGRLFTDSASLPQLPLEPAQFLTRWIAHLCAPTFVFLAGTSLALSAARRGDDGESIDGFIVKRGLLIAALDPLWMSWAFMDTPPTKQILFQVLYAIGGSFVVMALLRRLPSAVVGALGVALAVGHEALAGVWTGTSAALLVRGGPIALAGGAVTLICAYPLLPWLAIMMMGWGFGGFLRSGRDPRRLLLVAGLGALAVFAVVRGMNGYGNDLLYRRDASWIEWLHVSKYPPALAYDGLELGIMALALVAFFSVPSGSDPVVLRPLRLFGQTAFFYYLLHAHILIGVAHATGAYHEHGLGLAYVAAAAVAVLLHPLCRAYLSLKRRHPRSVLRYV
jgi:uncharacterized membrane protein